MDLVLELKISNPTDWELLQHLLYRLKIPFVQKGTAALPEPVLAVQPAILSPFSEETPQQVLDIWSPFDAYDAAEVLLQGMKNNSNPTQL